MMKLFFLLILLVFGASEKLHPFSGEFIDFINSKQSTWVAGRNFAEDVPYSQLKSLVGTLKNPNVTLDTKVHREREDIPEFFDAREHWPNCADVISTIRDQAACGSCWAVAAAETMSDRICIHSDGEKKISVSANDLLSCCGETCGFGCNGGFVVQAWLYWVRNGLVSGGEYRTTTGCKAYPFAPCSHYVESTINPDCGTNPETQECVKECDAGSAFSYEEDISYGYSAHVFLSRVSQIQTEILENGPVEATYVVYEDFLNYKSGVYQHVGGEFVGRHAVKIIGWGVEDDIPYWLVANSWNIDWGDKGFFKILRGENHVDIEDDVVAGLPKL